MSELEELLGLARHAVTTAAATLARADHQKLKQVVAVELAGRETKIVADSKLEELLLAGLSGSRLPVLAEESGAVGDLGSGRCWAVDPLDGSVNYLRGSGPSAISVALCDQGEPLFGVLHNISSGQLSWGGPGFGAWTEGVPIRVSQTACAEDGILCSGFPARFDTRAPDALPAYFRILGRFAKVRMLGSAASSLLMVARGEVDAYYEERIMLWDVAGGVALVRGAGGQARLTGTGLQQPYDVAASNARVTVATP